MKMTKKLTIVLALWTGLTLPLCLGQGENEQKKTRQEHIAWVAKCLMDFQSIKVGMTRGEVEKRFPEDGGERGVSPVRFTHPECGYFKIDVEFDFKRDAKEQGRAIESPEDKVTKISKPYIEAPTID
jgi:hypothetical protein